jgi:hypothetical protein
MLKLLYQCHKTLWYCGSRDIRAAQPNHIQRRKHVQRTETTKLIEIAESNHIHIHQL